ncbi:hypothetical protein VPH35_103958 [Triticum aestivum]|uniref:Uncharacterized protein n=1 Tax=Triticum turgidum subsp. durum TaxID=4567 RepID=A0A9R1AY16_TRITD|nr:unnamed protein product [Triticum turgidum subsp. durum]
MRLLHWRTGPFLEADPWVTERGSRLVSSVQRSALLLAASHWGLMPTGFMSSGYGSSSRRCRLSCLILGFPSVLFWAAACECHQVFVPWRVVRSRIILLWVSC